MNDIKNQAENSKSHTRGCIRRFRSLRAVLAADLYRYEGKVNTKAFVKNYLFTPGYKYIVIMRTCGWLRTKPFLALGFYPLFKWMLLRARYKFGFAIPEYMLVGPGLFINRFGGVYMNGDTIIGCNVNVTHGTMLGQANRGPQRGSPIIGNRVFIGAGAKIIGHIHVGNDSSIGSNAVVTKNVPTNGVVAGVPAKLLSTAGSEGYINRQVPEDMMRPCLDAFVGPVPDGFWE